jgi:ACS family D-galactonate transporter-like MFS transporter
MLALVSLAYFILFLHRSLLNYVQPPIKQELAFTDTQLGALRSAWMVAYCVAQLWVGYLGDRFRRRSILLASLLGSAVVLGAMGAAQSFPEMFVLQILLALVQSPSVPAIASTVADCFTPRTRSTAIGVFLISYNFSLVVGGWLGGAVADKKVWLVPVGTSADAVVKVAGWRMSHLLFGAVGAVACAVLLLLFREPARTERVEAAGLGTAGARISTTVLATLRVRTYLMIAFVFTLMNALIGAIQLWLPPFLFKQFHLQLQDAGREATLWIQVGTVVGLFCGGWLGDGWARRFLSGRTAVQVIGLSALVPALFFVGQSHLVLPEDPWPLLRAAMLLFGVGVGLYQANLWTTTFEVVDPAARATAIGLLNLSAGVLGFWVNPAIGRYHDSVGGLGVVIADFSIVAAFAVGATVLSMKLLLPGDYRGPLRR